MRVGVIDYGVGNLGSVMRALEGLRVAPILVTRAIDMHATDSLILPAWVTSQTARDCWARAAGLRPCGTRCTERTSHYSGCAWACSFWRPAAWKVRANRPQMALLASDSFRPSGAPAHTGL